MTTKHEVLDGEKVANANAFKSKANRSGTNILLHIKYHVCEGVNSVVTLFVVDNDNVCSLRPVTECVRCNNGHRCCLLCLGEWSVRARRGDRDADDVDGVIQEAFREVIQERIQESVRAAIAAVEDDFNEDEGRYRSIAG